MNIENFKLFCLVVEEGSITNAARMSYISQPAVTKKISQLENEYGTLLFERNGGKLELTNAGEVLYPYAKEVIENVKRSFDAVQKMIGNEGVNLHIGASLTIGEYLLPQILGTIKRAYPNITFSLTIGNTPHMIALLENNEIDIALVESHVENPILTIEKFAEDELILVTSNEHRWKYRNSIEISELVDEKMIWREPESGSRLIVENYLRDYGILEDIESEMELGSIQSIKSAVEAGLGISILPRITVLKELELGTLRQVNVTNFSLTRTLWLVQKPHRFPKIGLQHFIDFIRNH
ncbi:LysR family transcriptional regulator [Bacillus timonensis]|uniref:LysR family transcriptional regulator n=1 Tax=Bacillus timonensis TaxID=1033734 RepID=UPI00028A3D9D|nr:LysR family transcriptional regulator [Bacillus timonensis]